MKKILIITQKVDQDDSVLGFFHAWINEFSKHYEKVTVICLWKGKYSLPNNVKVFSLGKEEGVSKFTYIFRLYKYIWQERNSYDSIFVHMNPIYVILCGLFWKIFDKRISLWYTHKHVDLKLRIAEKIVDKIFSASKTSFRLKSKKLEVLGHGIDTDKFFPSETSNTTPMLKMVTVGRITEIKNYEVMIDAVEILERKNIPVTLEIIGAPITLLDHVYNDKLKKIVTEKGLLEKVLFLGEMKHDQIRTNLVNKDVFLNMCNVGSFDKAALEAMSCAILVISSNKGFEEIYAEPGFVIEPDNPQALADKMTYIFNNKDESKKIGKGLREIVVREHNLSVLIKKLVEKI